MKNIAPFLGGKFIQYKDFILNIYIKQKIIINLINTFNYKLNVFFVEYINF